MENSINCFLKPSLWDDSKNKIIIMEFSIQLAGWVLHDPVFQYSLRSSGVGIPRGVGGLIKLKIKLTLKFILGDLKHF